MVHEKRVLSLRSIRQGVSVCAHVSVVVVVNILFQTKGYINDRSLHSVSEVLC